MRTILISIIVVSSSAALSLAAGCGGGNSCEDVIANMAKVFGFGGSSYGDMRAKAIAGCKEQKFSDKVRTCMASAKDKGAFMACERLTEQGDQGGAEEYLKKSKKSEAELNLHSIQKALKAHFAENAEYPRGSAPLTPAAPCCEGPNHKCAADMALWSGNPVWDALDFQIDEAGYFQYSYESTDGLTARATAVGDLDCDSTTITFELMCESAQGSPTCTLAKPSRSD